MRIVVDINHPAHVHYFKNFIWEMQKRGHEILITASEKDISYTLLDNFGFSYVKIGNYGKSILRKMVNIPILDWKMYRAVKKFNPDIFMGFGSIRAAHVSKLMGKPYIALDDTEHAKWEHLMYVPLTDAILTPSCFRKDLGKKQIRYNGFTELAYLHPKYFTPDPSVLKEIGLSKGDPFIVLRFVSWNASHDIGQKGIDNKETLVKNFEQYGRVFISSEGPLRKDLRKYELHISPEKIHHVLSFAQLYFGEGGTMATEAALLGTPSIFVSTLSGTMGNFIELEQKYGLVFNFNDPKLAIEKALTLLKAPHLKENWTEKRNELLNDKIDVSAFLVGMIEGYPY
jgi:hypothetical protein